MLKVNDNLVKTHAHTDMQSYVLIYIRGVCVCAYSSLPPFHNVRLVGQVAGQVWLAAVSQIKGS